MRGGLPPDSRRAIADCVVPQIPGQLRLGEAELTAALGDLPRDLGEEPAVLGARKSFTEPVDSALDRMVSVVLRESRHRASATV